MTANILCLVARLFDAIEGLFESTSSQKRIAKVFHTENGHGKIEWQVMEVNDFLRKLLDKNNWMLEFINHK